MNLIKQIQQSFVSYIKQTFAIDDQLANNCAFTLNIDEKKQAFGDLNSNAAMILAKHFNKNPREIAQEIVQQFSHEYIEKIDIAGPGFLNAFLTKQALQQLAHNLFCAQETFFVLDPSMPKHNYSIEFVSANPTGPLHLGHGRGGIIGDVLSNILTFLGHKVTKEYYINDAGAQIQKLGQSFKIRCQQAAGIGISMPEDAYHGEYLINLAQECVAHHGKALFEKPDTFFQDYAKNHLLQHIKTTLHDYGITFDVWFSEKTLHESGSIEQAIDMLKQKQYLYEKDGALWFTSTKFGDDKDRVLRKSTGELTYVAADLAYLCNKVDRGFDHLIMVLGHDHHSYAIRLQGARKALGLSKYPLDIILYQLVKMKASGQLVRMSKRAGTLVALTDVIRMVGTDVTRFFYLNKKADAQLEFDLDLALKKTEENPVYYVQYAYVRTNSILKKAEHEASLSAISDADAIHVGPHEALLIKKIVSLKSLLKDISSNHQTHLLTYYILELADTFHSYYAKHRVIDLDNPQQSRGRLLLIILLKNTFELCLKLLGISRPEKM